MAQAASYCTPCLLSRHTAQRTTNAGWTTRPLGEGRRSGIGRPGRTGWDKRQRRPCGDVSMTSRTRAPGTCGSGPWLPRRGEPPVFPASFVDHEIDHQHASQAPVVPRHDRRMRCVVPSTRIAYARSPRPATYSDPAAPVPRGVNTSRGDTPSWIGGLPSGTVPSPSAPGRSRVTARRARPSRKTSVHGV